MLGRLTAQHANGEGEKSEKRKAGESRRELQGSDSGGFWQCVNVVMRTGAEQKVVPVVTRSRIKAGVKAKRIGINLVRPKGKSKKSDAKDGFNRGRRLKGRS